MCLHRGLSCIFNPVLKASSMEITLKKLFASNTKVDEFDVKQMKKALNRLQYYYPPEDIGITGIAGRFLNGDKMPISSAINKRAFFMNKAYAKNSVSSIEKQSRVVMLFPVNLPMAIFELLA